MTHCVTVGLNGSPESRAAARWAAGEAELRGVSLDLVHVEEWLEHPPVHVSTTEERRHWADSVLHDAAEETRRAYPSMTVRTRRVGGLPSPALVDASAASDMLVIGSRALGSVAGFFLGSTASTTISEAKVPVILVRAPNHQETSPNDDRVQEPVVVGVDVGQPCDQLLAFAFTEAAYRGCPLLVIHSCSLPPVLGYAPSLQPGLVQAMITGAANTLKQEISPWSDKFPSVPVDVRAAVGHAAMQIPRLAVGAALVVVGRRTRDAAQGMHIGPITHAVIHHAISPVAVIAHE